MLFIFVRHGQTDYNALGIIQGQLDTPLNDQGRHEAKQLATRLANVPITHIYTSDLARAHETAVIIARKHNRPVRSDPRLRERGLGSMEGRRRLRGESAPADAESRDELLRRTADWFVERLSRHRMSDVILTASHGAYLGNLVNVFLRFGFSVRQGLDLDAHCVNTCIMTVHVWWDERWKGRIDTWGDAEHLVGYQVQGRVDDDVK